MLWVLQRTVGSFEHLKQMFKFMDKKIFTILHPFFCLPEIIVITMRGNLSSWVIKWYLHIDKIHQDSIHS